MEVGPLESRLESFLAAARAAISGPASRVAGSEGDGWGLDMQLAHVASNERLIGLAVAEAIGGGRAAYRNDAVIDEGYLRALVDASGGLDDLLEDVERGGCELLALARRCDERLGTPIHVFIREGDSVLVDADWTAGQLLASNFTVHLRLHERQLRGGAE